MSWQSLLGICYPYLDSLVEGVPIDPDPCRKGFGCEALPLSLLPLDSLYERGHIDPDRHGCGGIGQDLDILPLDPLDEKGHIGSDRHGYGL